MDEELMKLKIGSDPLQNISYWGLSLMKSGEMFGGNIKDSNIVKVEFPEEQGTLLYLPENPKTSDFDYTVTFGFVPRDDEVTSERIKSFWNDMKGKEIELVNLYKGVALRVYALSLTDGSFYPNSHVFVFDVKFYCPSGIVTPIV